MIKEALILSISAFGLKAYNQEINQQPLSLSLGDAQEYALQNSYANRDKRIELKKARQTIRETAATGLPQINASLDYEWNPQIARQPVPAELFGGTPGTFHLVAFGIEHQNSTTITVNQLLLDASYFVALQAARVVKEISMLELEKSEIDVRANVAQSYYGALVSEKTVEILKENLGSLKKSLFETRQLFKNGFIEEQDVDQLELLVNNLSNTLKDAKRQAGLAKMLLNYNIGLPIMRETTLKATLEEAITSDNEIVLPNEFNYKDHIDYRTIESQKKAMQLQLSYEKVAWYPTLSGFLRHGQTNFQNDFNDVFSFDQFWIPGTTVGVSLSWDIFQGLSGLAKIQKAKLDRDKIEIALDGTSSLIKLQYHQAKSNYTFALDNYNNQKKNVEISKKVRDRERIKYQKGTSRSFDLSQVENQYLETQKNYVQALLNLLNSKEELQKALGK